VVAAILVLLPTERHSTTMRRLVSTAPVPEPVPASPQQD
jgi:hypothetical protein